MALQLGVLHSISGICRCTCVWVSPVSVSEDEPAELQVSQDDSLAVTVCHGVQHLGEQKPRLLLAQTLLAAHIRMHVSMVTW